MSPGCHCIYDAGTAHGASDTSSLVDVVAIHDVCEDPLQAWTDPESGTNWLHDLLPKHVRVGRVVSYGYDATVRAFGADDAPENIQRMAESLVQELRANRQFAGTLQRPIIFICHGLGGVLLKKSLIYSSTRTAPKVVHLWDQFVSTFAILFFGTPHGRSASANWLALEQLSRPSWPGAKSVFHGRGGPAVGESLQLPQSASNDFMPLVKQFHMFFFWEALPTPLKSGRAVFVVDPESAVPKLDNTESAAIHATHSGMVKFGSKDASDYCTVLAALVNYCEKAPDIISHRWDQAESALRQLRTSEAWELGGYGFDVRLEQPFRHQNIPVNNHFYPPQEMAATFVGRRGELQTLHAALFPKGKGDTGGDKNIYVVFGMGGSGKTQFCSKFAHEYKERYAAVFTIYAASRETIVDSLSRIGKLAGLEATENSGRHFLSQLAGPWLLIMDNADDPTLQLEDYYPPGNAAHILVTTRNPDFRRQGTRGSLELGGLSGDDALQLLLMKADISTPWDVPTREAAGVITKALGYLALALIQAGNCIYRQLCKLGDYLSLLSAARNALRQRKASEAAHQVHEDEIVRVVYSTFDVSLGLLPKQPALQRDAADLLRVFSFFHFEHIPVQMLEKAFKNRARSAKGPPSGRLVSRLANVLLRRLRPPEMLPDFLQFEDGEEPDKYRIMRAIVELRSLSLIGFDGRYVSLHPLVHAWARDTLSNMEQRVWLGIALNTLLESISLPGSGGGDVDCEFHRDVLPHLEVCLQEHGSPVSDWVHALEGPWLRVSLLLQPTMMLIIRDQVQRAAKCGFVFAERGLFESARAHLQGVKEVLVRTLGETSDKTQMAMLGLAASYWGLGQVDQAIALQRVVVDARNRVLGPMHEQTLLAMDQLGKSYWLHGLHREALDVQEATSEGMKSIITPRHALYPQALAAMDNLGVTLSAWRRYADSADVHREVLEARKAALGETHPDTLATKANLAMALLDLGCLDEAKENMEVVHGERQRQLGKEHPWTLWALCYLAKVWVATGELKKAEDTLLWGVEAGVRSLSETHHGVLMGRGVLARVYARQGRLDEAETLSLETVGLIQKSLGAAHPDCVYGRLKLAHLHVLKGELVLALQSCRAALEGVDMRITRAHPLGSEVERLATVLEDPSSPADDLASLVPGMRAPGQQSSAAGKGCGVEPIGSSVEYPRKRKSRVPTW